jgi:hypothetical protein
VALLVLTDRLPRRKEDRESLQNSRLFSAKRESKQPSGSKPMQWTLSDDIDVPSSGRCVQRADAVRHGGYSVGLDIAKRVFQQHGVDAAGKAVLRRKLQRSELLAFFKALPPGWVGIEACGTAHYWAREIRELGHEVRLMPPSYVSSAAKPTRLTPRRSARLSRPTMRFVPIKTAE